MSRSRSEPVELTYSLGTAARLTGLSPALLRAWERRYGVVEPVRTPGGTRRYRASDLEHLKRLKAAVDAGHRIGQVAGLDPEELERRLRSSPTAPTDRLEEILSAVERMDSAEAHRLLSQQLSALGPVRFARNVAVPLAREIGERWSGGQLSIAAEHLATGLLRSLLGSALQPTAASLVGPRITFATPTGERHELGLQMAALTALGAGANPVYLGTELPVEEMLGAVERAAASALALSLVAIPPTQAAQALRAIRAGLPPAVRVWTGGVCAQAIDPIEGVECVHDLAQFEAQVVLLRETL